MALIAFTSCETEQNARPQGTAFNMAGKWNIVVQDYNNNLTRYCTVELTPISPNRALMIYGTCTGSNNIFFAPNDTLDFSSSGNLTICRDTFYLNGSRIIHYGTGTYTQNSMLIPDYQYFLKQGTTQLLYTYGYQLTR